MWDMFVFFFLFYKHTASNPQATTPGLKVVNMSWHFRSTQQWPKKARRSFLKPNTSFFAYVTHSNCKAAFDKHAEESGVMTIPSKSGLYFTNCNHEPSTNTYLWYEVIAEFCFNFKTSIFGKVIPSPTSNSRPLPHLYFIATPLLPCGPVDPKVEKFTGSGDIGPANDHMTKAIHAFAQFSAVYTQNNLLICDLQGTMHTPNSRSEISLINFKLIGVLDMRGTVSTVSYRSPKSQVITNCSLKKVFINNSCSSHPKPEHYWDQGEKTIFTLLNQHKEACQTNWVCNALNLANIITTTTDPLGNESDLSASSSPPRKRAKYTGKKKNIHAQQPGIIWVVIMHSESVYIFCQVITNYNEVFENWLRRVTFWRWQSQIWPSGGITSFCRVTWVTNWVRGFGGIACVEGWRADAAVMRRLMTDLPCMRSRVVLYNVTRNNSGVEDPQNLSDLAFLGKNRPEPARQP